MTKRDFELVAETIATVMSDYPLDSNMRWGMSVLARRLASSFETANPRFDHEKFFTACGLGSNGVDY